MKLDDALGSARTVFLDSAPVIYYVEGTAKYQPVADVLFDRMRSGTLTAVTSSMTLAECLVMPYRNGDRNGAQNRSERDRHTHPLAFICVLIRVVCGYSGRLRVYPSVRGS